VTTLLQKMNHAITIKSDPALKQCVGDAFDAIDRGDKLVPKHMKFSKIVTTARKHNNFKSIKPES
jgi:hypothetical protein